MKIIFNVGGIMASLIVKWAGENPYDGNNLEIHHAVHKHSLNLRQHSYPTIQFWDDFLKLILKGSKKV